MTREKGKLNDFQFFIFLTPQISLAHSYTHIEVERDGVLDKVDYIHEKA